VQFFKDSFRAAIAGFVLWAALPVASNAADVKVVTSGAFTAAFLELGPQYEKATHNKVITEFGASMGTTHDAIPMRLQRGEQIDVVIMGSSPLEELVKQGKIRPGSRVDLVHSKTGMAVKAGAPKPDISTLEAFKKAVLGAKSIGYSDSVGGVYLATELFPQLGIWDQIKARSKKIEGLPVGNFVANGEVEIGFQQISELKPVKGIDIVGELPPGAQRVMIFGAGIPTTAKDPEGGKALIEWLASPAAYPAIRKSGLEAAK